MEAAVSLISEQGWTDTSLQDVAKRSGYSAALVGQRFGSKLGLLEALVETHRARGTERLGAIETGGERPLWRAGIELYCSAIRDPATWHGAMLVLMAEALGPLQETRELFSDLNRRFVDYAGRFLREDMESSQAGPRLPLRLVARLRGLHLLSHLDPEIDLGPLAQALVRDVAAELEGQPLPSLATPIEPLPPREKPRSTPSREGRLSQAERRERTNLRLLGATAELLAERGAKGTTVQSIAERSGLSPGMVSQRFGSKEGLIVEGIERLVRRRSQLFEEAERMPRALDAIDAMLRIHGATQVSGNRMQTLILVLMGEALGPLRAQAETFREINRSFARQLAHLIEKGQREGDILETIEPQGTALGVLATLRGLAMMSLLDPEIDLLGALEEHRRVVAAKLMR